MNTGAQLRAVAQCNPELLVAYGACLVAIACISRGAVRNTNLIMSLPAFAEAAAENATKVVPINGGAA